MDDRARNIVARLAASLDTPYRGSSSMTPTVYDTAWVSMVSKEETRDGVTASYWLFPECFQAVLESQSPVGGFGVNGGSQVDGILSTMAALLALCKLQRSPSVLGGPEVPPDLQDRIDKARAYLDQALQRWDVRSTVQVGFEILVPSLLGMLQDEAGMNINFPGRKALMALNRRKMDKIKPAMFYSHHRTTLLHSLESFVGSVEFGKMSHSLTNGSMMGSPSSTAAYLINSSRWDEDAEKYLRFVVAANGGNVPSAFPISVFELSWVLSTLLGSGFTADALGRDNVSKLADYLEARLEDNNGVTGFAPEMLADGDDTAKTIYSLGFLDRSTNCEAMLKAFEGPTYFKTYSLETKESLSTNCNVLIALLGSEDSCQHLPQISKALNFLCSAWYDGKWSDKWNVEPQYTMMLFADALASAVGLWDNGALEGLQPELLADRVPVVTLQILVRTVSAQAGHGSWKDSAEVTAYAVLTLKALASLPWTKMAMVPQVDESIELGIKYLKANEDSWSTPAVIWVEKVNYGSSILAETYCLAALKATPSTPRWGAKVSGLCNIPMERVDRFSRFFSGLPLFREEPAWRLRASIVEGYLLAPALRRAALELDLFPQREGKYLEYIPCTWTTSNNNAGGFGLSTKTMIEMMVISTLNFQVDKWFEETTEDGRLRGDLEALKIVIRQLFNEDAREYEKEMLPNGYHNKRRQLSNGTSATPVTDSDGKATLLREASSTLSRFVTHVLTKVSAASPPASLRQRVQHELSTFLLAHVTHGEDNTRLAKRDKEEEQQQQQQQQDSHAFASAKTYYEWVRTTSADHTSCPYSFEFFRCLVSSSACNGGDCFAGTRARYLAQDACRHLATMCRQYNDYGSISRDREENNLNSINFPEFHYHEENGGRGGGGGGGEIDERCSSQPDDDNDDNDNARRTLLEIASYERECLELAVKKLRPEITEPAWKAWKVFIDVTNLYGQIYVVKDINSDAKN